MERIVCSSQGSVENEFKLPPQFDGQTERVNHFTETYLRCFVNACPKHWLSWVHLAEFSYNSSHHSSIGCSPFEALYGYPPTHFGIAPSDSCSVESLNN
jgi:hypothetical protein